MAKVPMYEGGVAEQALPGVRQTGAIEGAFVDHSGAALAEGFGRAANVLAMIGQDQENRARTAHLKELDVNAGDTMRGLLHDPENGFMNKQGRNAIDARNDTIKRIDDYAKEVTTGLKDEVAQREWQRIFAGRREHALNQIETHTSAQTKAYSIQQTAARADEQSRTMIDNWTDAGNPGAFANAKATGLDEIKSLGKQQGWSDEVISDKQRAYMTSAHGAVLDQIMSLNRSGEARSYFDRYQGEIDVAQHDVIRKKLEHAGIKADSLNLAMELQGSMKSFSAQEAELDKQYKAGKISAELYDATKQRIEHDYSKRKMMQAEGDKSMMGAAQDYLLKNPNATALDLPPNVYAWAKNTGHLQALDSFSRSGGRFAQDTKAWLEFTNLPPEKMAEMSSTDLYNQFRTKFDDRHLEQANSMLLAVKGVGKNGQPVEGKHSNIWTVNEQIKNSAREAGIIPWHGNPGDTAAKRYAAFEKSVDRGVNSFETSVLKGQRKANAEEVQKVIDKLLIAGDTNGWLPFGDKNYYEVKGTADEKSFVPSISTADRGAIVAKLRSAGKPTDDKTVVEWYRRWKGM